MILTARYKVAFADAVVINVGDSFEQEVSKTVQVAMMKAVLILKIKTSYWQKSYRTCSVKLLNNTYQHNNAIDNV